MSAAVNYGHHDIVLEQKKSGAMVFNISKLVSQS